MILQTVVGRPFPGSGRVVALVFAILALPGASTPADRGQEAGALIAQVRGRVNVVPHASGQPVAARIGLVLAHGDSLDVAPGSRVVLLHHNGRLVTATSSMVVAPTGGAGAQAIHARAAEALARAAEAPRPDTVSGVGRPPPGSTQPLEPVRGTSVLAVRPVFRWWSESGTDEVLVQIRAVGGGRPVRFITRESGSWTLPDSAQALVPGVEYAWTVVATQGGRAPGEARFRVLDNAARQTLADLERSLSAAGIDPASDGLLVMAGGYADLGLASEALAALERLEREAGPGGTAPLVGRMKARVLEALGRPLEAAAAWDQIMGGSR